MRPHDKQLNVIRWVGWLCGAGSFARRCEFQSYYSELRYFYFLLILPVDEKRLFLHDYGFQQIWTVSGNSSLKYPWKTTDPFAAVKHRYVNTFLFIFIRFIALFSLSWQLLCANCSSVKSFGTMFLYFWQTAWNILILRDSSALLSPHVLEGKVNLKLGSILAYVKHRLWV